MQKLHYTHWTPEQKQTLNRWVHSLPVRRVDAHALAKGVDAKVCLQVVRTGTVIELHNLPLTVVIRDDSGHCVAVNLDGTLYVAAYWYNVPHDNHATLNVKAYLPKRNPIRWLAKQGVDLTRHGNCGIL